MMYRFRVEYYLKPVKGPTRATFVGVVSNNFGQAQNKAVKLIKKKYPSGGYNIYNIRKLRKIVKK